MSRLQTNAIRHLGSAVDNLTLDNAGRILLPNQPAFFAGLTSGRIVQNVQPIFNSVQTNVGNHYNPSTGVFTCPVAGTYSFRANVMTDNSAGTSGHMSAVIQVNATTVAENLVYRPGVCYMACHISYVCKLNAGDAVRVYCGSAAGDYWYGALTQHANFGGHLIG